MAIENITQAQKESLIKLYLAYFNRAPESAGLEYHVNQFLADLNAGLTETQAFAKRADNFYDAAISMSAQTGFSTSQTAVQFVERVYENVLLRPGAGGTAPTDAEKAYWVGQLESGALTRGALITEFLGAVDHLIANGTPAEQAVATQVKTVLDARLAVSLEFSKPEHSGKYTTPEAAYAAGSAVLIGVVDPASAAAAIAALGVSSQDLTSGVDILSGNVFNAPRGFTEVTLDQVNTLNDDDVLTGLSDADVLNFEYVQNSVLPLLDVIITPTLVDIETINVKFSTPVPIAVLDLQDASQDGVGDTSVNLSRIALTNLAAGVNNLMYVPDELSINNSNATSALVLFGFSDLGARGDNDATTLTLNNAQVLAVGLQEFIDFLQIGGGLGNVIVGDQGIEHITLNSVGANGNKVGFLFAEEAQDITVVGDQDLTLGLATNLKNNQGTTEAIGYQAGLLFVQGSLDTIDASAFTGDLDLTVGTETLGIYDGTSGVKIDFVIKGGSGDDTFRLTAGVDGKGDTIDGGAGNNQVALYGGNLTTGTFTNIQDLEIRDQSNGGAIKVDTSLFSELDGVLVRNESTPHNPAASNITLTNLSPVVAANLTVLHGTTASNAINSLVLNAALKTDTANDLVGVTIADGVNQDPRFNFTLNAAKVESITINDTDTESNSVFLGALPQHTGTLTLTGGAAGQFLNLDTSFGAFPLLGILAKDVSGQANDGTGVWDAGAGATGFQGAAIDATAYLGDVIVRVTDNVNAVNGGQSIKMGDGNDWVVFDNIASTTAGLSISDKVDGGAGNNTLAIDGHGLNINISASEWTNVTNFQTVHLVGNGVAGTNLATIVAPWSLNDAYGKNAYNLTLTNDFIAANGVAVAGGRVINIVNDNGPGSPNSGVTIDARQLNAQSNFTYDGQEASEGATTADRFIMSDANVNGLAQIDGGAELAGANADILEIRNSAVVTIGDLEGIKNVGTIEFTNDQAASQLLILQLDSATVENLVNSTTTASATNIETLTIVAYDNWFGGATTAINLDASLVQNTFLSLNVTGGSGNDVFRGGTGADTFTGGAGADTFVFGTGESTMLFADTVVDFTTGVDQINFLSFDPTDPDLVFIFDGSALTQAQMITQASTSMASGFNDVVVFWNAEGTGDAYVFSDTDGNGIFDQGTDGFVVLTGVNAAALIAAGDFI